MKKLTLLLLFFAFVSVHHIYAQPTWYFTPEQQVVDEGEPVCFSLKTEDFTDLIEITFTVAWDAGVLSSPSVQNVDPLFSNANFVVDEMAGTITFEWSDGQNCATATSGPDLPDDATLFDVCFVATGIYGNHTPICITDTPMDMIVRRSSANCVDIGEFADDCGFCSIGTPPLTVNISSGDGYEGDIVCLEFEVEDFDDLVSFQYAIYWDSSVLEYESVLPMNLQEFSLANIGQTQTENGILNLSWWTTSSGVSVPDGTQILQVCFKIIGECGDETEVYIGPNPPEPIEVINLISGQGNGTNIGLLQSVGNVSVNCFDPNSINVEVEGKDVCPGEQFTVDVTVGDFDDITKLQFNLKWNPDVIDLNNNVPDGISFPGGDDCFLFQTSVDATPSQGFIEVDWSTQSFGCDLPDNYVLMRLHFTAVGAGGTNTTIAIVNPIFVDEFGGQQTNIGINNNNGLVNICELDNPTIFASSANALPGDTICIQFDVQDFDDITRTQYTILWEPNVLSYLDIPDAAMNLTNLSMNNFLMDQVNQGVMGVEWENASPVSVPDGSTIFEICFVVVGNPGECSGINFTDLPWPIDVETATSSGTNVGLNGQPGNVCVDNPLGFFVALPDKFGSFGSEVCLDLTVENFTQLKEMQYSINWNTNILLYDRIEGTGNLPNFDASSYDDDIALTEDGQAVIHWNSDNNLQGTTLSDGTSIFQICFIVVGNAGDCSGVTVSEFPEPYVIKSAPTGDANLGLESQAGSVCINASIDFVGATITDVACPSIPTGAIDISITGGSGEYVYQWTGFGANPISEDQNGLFPGEYFVTVTDAGNPALEIEEQFTVGLTANAPVADAGLDTTRNCGALDLILDGSGSSSGANITYFWESLPGALPGVVLEGETTPNPTIFGGEAYLLTVQDGITGCMDMDTVLILPPNIATPELADFADTITCAQDTVMLDGGNTSFGFDITWTTSGGSIVSGTENQLQSMATSTGWYYLTFSDDATNCEQTDSIFVEENVLEPTAMAGDDDVIGCNDEEAALDGSTSSSGNDFIYEWSPMGGGEVCGDETAIQTTVCAPGTYQLMVTNVLNGCTAVDVVEVEGDTLKPTADAGPDLNLDCVVDMVTLDGSNSSQGNEFTYSWSDGMNEVGTDISLDVSMEGTYILTVMDTTNDCSAISEVTVADLSETVEAVANASNGITCDVDTAQLSWTGSATGADYIYQWQDPSGMSIGSDEFITVTESGMYTIVVTNTLTQCEGTSEVSVDDLTTPPPANAGDDTEIGCVDFITLQGTADPDNPNLIYQWSGPGAGCITDGTTLEPSVSCPGEYTLNVVDTSTGCANSSTLMVEDNQTEPGADAGANADFPCSATELTLNGSSNSTDITVEWTSIPSVPIIDGDQLTPTVTEPAQYILTVTGTNGCTSSASILISEPTPPVADAGGNATVDCLTTQATLSGAGSTLDNTTLTWVALSGDDPSDPNAVEITVGEGEYQLTVEDQNGCTSVDVVTVENIGDLSPVSAGGNVELPCDATSVSLAGSSDPGLTYTWTDENMAIVGSELTLEVTEPGTYTLTVYNDANFCESSDQAVVTLAEGGDPAEATADHDPCEAEAMLLGNLPTGATGVWTSLTGGQIDDPTAETALASGFSEGENTFVWTLTLGNCIDYSSDTLTLQLDQSVPNANSDFATIDELSGGTVSVNVLDNDVFDPTMTSFALLDNSTVLGEVSMAEDGTVTYTKERCFVGTAQIAYELCNTNCPDLCTEAILAIEVVADDSEGCDEVPNAITPNGDGVNDELVFDILLSNPNEDFPDNELIVFNRWGDIVYQAKPYQNDWSGTNDSGKELPHGTYYYIFRLNIADGEIIRGDVTILK